MAIGVGKIRHALGDGAMEQQAKRVFILLRDAGLLDEVGAAPELLGVAEIAKRAGVTSAAVCQWSDLPDPVVRLKQGRIWFARDVDRYLSAREESRRA